MIWQDFAFTAGSLIFVVALLPAVFGKDKPPMSTSSITGSVLGVFAVTYLTLDLYLSAGITAITAAMWWTLFYQKHVAERTELGWN